MKAFTSKPAAAQKDIDFELDGTHYSFSPPKTTSQLIGIMSVRGKDTQADLERASHMLAWFGNGLNKEHQPRKGEGGHEEFVEGCQACDIDDKLNDPTPGTLELETVMEVIGWLMEESSSRPTT